MADPWRAGYPPMPTPKDPWGNPIVKPEDLPPFDVDEFKRQVDRHYRFLEMSLRWQIEAIERLYAKYGEAKDG